MSEWIEHDGKGIPIPAETIVGVKFRDGGEIGTDLYQPARYWGLNSIDSNWVHMAGNYSRDDIIAYRVITPSEASLTPP